jgi:hypothetical protein
MGLLLLTSICTYMYVPAEQFRLFNCQNSCVASYCRLNRETRIWRTSEGEKQGPGHSPLYDAMYTRTAIAPLGYQTVAMLVIWHTWSELNN